LKRSPLRPARRLAILAAMKSFDPSTARTLSPAGAGSGVLAMLRRGVQLSALAAAASALLLAGCGTHAPATGSSIYVSPSGDDANPGTRDQPVRSLARARDLVRAMTQTMSTDVFVWVGGGTYRLTEPLVLSEADSGTGGHDVIYASMSSERPVISGGGAVTGWKQVDAAKNLWSAPAPASLANTRQLYVNGVRAYRTRGRLPVKLTETATGYTASSDVMASWRNVSDIEFVYTGGNAIWSERSEGLGAWTEPRCPVAKIEGTTITMAQPGWDNSTKRVMLPPSIPFRRPANLVGPSSVGREPASVENAYELLGTPGQWYFDRSAATIYYVPRPGEDLATADVEAPALETLVSGDGTDGHPVHNVVFKGLQFSYATWLFPSSPEGFPEIQANYLVTGPTGYATQGLCDLATNGACPFGAWTRSHGNVTFSFDNHVRFLGDAFVHLGGAGLELGTGTQSDSVEGCVFTDISANGIELGGVDLPEASDTQVTRDNRIVNNHIYNVAAEFHGGIGIDVGYTQRTLIQHNQIDHQPYSGISMGWGGWLDKIRRAGVANNSCDAVVANNLIFDHMLLLADGGGIYTQGLTGPSLAEGEKLTGNVIHDQYGSGHGIYTDNGCNNVTARSNVIFHTDHDNWGGRHHDYYPGEENKGSDAFDFENNYWQQGDPDSSAQNVTLKNNQIIASLDQAPAAYVENAGLEAMYQNLLSQTFCSPAAPEPPSRVAAYAASGRSWVTWNPAAFDGGAPVDSYTVTASTGGQASISADDFRAKAFVEVDNLPASGDLTFTVTAHNANGTSSPSLPSNPVTMHTGTINPPSAPGAAFARVVDGRASIHFQAPDNDGGAPVTSYLVTINPGGRQVSFTGRQILVLGGRHATFSVVDGLDASVTNTFELSAVNQAGPGPATTARVGRSPEQ
jgi:hypothetical protein